MTMKVYINYVAYIAISRGYLSDMYCASEFRMSSNIILFGNRITSVLCNRLRTGEHSVVSMESSCNYSTLGI